MCRRSGECYAQGCDDGWADAEAGRDLRDVIPAGARSGRGHLLRHDQADVNAYWLGYARARSAARLLLLIEAAANVLCWRGHLELDEDEEIPADMQADMIEIAVEGTCDRCLSPTLTPDALADHFLGRKKDEYDRSLPVWACECGAAYKVLPPCGDFEDLFQLIDDDMRGPLCAASEPRARAACPHASCREVLFGGGGLVGDRLGQIRRNAKGQVRHSDSCPGCGKLFAAIDPRYRTKEPAAVQLALL